MVAGYRAGALVPGPCMGDSLCWSGTGSSEAKEKKKKVSSLRLLTLFPHLIPLTKTHRPPTVDKSPTKRKTFQDSTLHTSKHSKWVTYVLATAYPSPRPPIRVSCGNGIEGQVSLIFRGNAGREGSAEARSQREGRQAQGLSAQGGTLRHRNISSRNRESIHKGQRGSRKKQNAAAKDIQCQVCKATFLKTTKAPA